MATITTELKGVTPRYRAPEKRSSRKAFVQEINREHRQGMGRLSDVFLEHLAIKHYSAETISGYGRCLRFFLSWAQARELCFPAEVDTRILESYQCHIYRHRKKDGQHLSVASQRRLIQVVKQFFAWLEKKGHLDRDPAEHLEYPRSQGRPINLSLTQEEVMRILAQPDVSSLYGLRDRAILELMYSTGMRRSELVKLERADLYFDKALILIRQGKGNKDRLVPLGARAANWLQAYAEKVRPQLVQSATQQRFFLSYYGDPIHRDVLSRYVKKYMKQAGVNHVGSCHQFRHACATHMLNNGAESRYIQELLGHADPKSTQVYAKLDIRQLQKVHREKHPSEA